MNQVNHSFQNPIEKEAWESFEVGAFDDVWELAQKNSNNLVLEHLAYISCVENGNEPPKAFTKKESLFLTLVESYHLLREEQKSESLRKYVQYLQNPKSPLSFSILQYGIRLSFELAEYSICLSIIQKDSNPENSKFYAKEKLVCLYHLKKFPELVQHFKGIYQYIQDENQTYFMVGMALLGLGKFKEAELIMNKVPKKLNLPTYEEKKREFLEKQAEIAILEKKKDLSLEELKDLGFAYLFNSEFEKAEEIFKKAASKAA